MSCLEIEKKSLGRYLDPELVNVADTFNRKYLVIDGKGQRSRGGALAESAVCVELIVFRMSTGLGNKRMQKST